MSRLRRTGWILIVALTAAVAGLMIGLAVVAVAETTAPSFADDSADSLPEPQPAPEGRVVPTPGDPASSVTSEGSPVGIFDLVDASWVTRVAESTGIPARALAAYAGADLRARQDEGCAVGWNILAAIGFVESAHGAVDGGRIDPDGVARPYIFGIPLDGTRSAVIRDTDAGAIDGDTLWDRAAGPLQFIPDTWKRWGTDGDGDGIADVHDIDDAALTAARYLCHARGTLEGSDAWSAAIRSYNDNTEYLLLVTESAARYGSFTGP